jgi:hypothetical protein
MLGLDAHGWGGLDVHDHSGDVGTVCYYQMCVSHDTARGGNETGRNF